MPFCGHLLAWVLSVVLCTIYSYRIFSKCSLRNLIVWPTFMFSNNWLFFSNRFVSIWYNNVRLSRSNIFSYGSSSRADLDSVSFHCIKYTFQCTLWYTPANSCHFFYIITFCKPKSYFSFLPLGYVFISTHFTTCKINKHQTPWLSRIIYDTSFLIRL